MTAQSPISYSFSVPQKELAFWNEAASSSPLSPFAEKLLSSVRVKHRGCWEVRFGSGVIFAVFATTVDGNVRFIGEAWNARKGEDPRETRPRKRLLGTYRIVVDGNAYEVTLKKGEE